MKTLLSKRLKRLEIWKSEILTSDEDLLYFQKKANELIGTMFPIDYLKQGQVRAFKNKEGQIAGGYAMILKPPFRTIDSLPKDISVDFELDEAFEITGLWMDKNLRSSVKSVQLWLKFAKDLSSLKEKKFFIYAYDLNKKRLQEIYSYARPTVLFRGEVKKLLGNKHASYESVEYASSRAIKFMPIYAFPNLMSKLFFNSLTLAEAKVFNKQPLNRVPRKSLN